MNPKQEHHSIDTLFLLLLFAIFAVGLLLVAVFGANQYKTTVSAMDKNHEVRVCASYIQEKVHQADSSDGIRVSEVDGHSILVLPETYNDRSYATYIYVYDGWLYEVLLSDSTDFCIGSGQQILEADDIKFEPQNSHLILTTIVHPDKIAEQFYISTKSDAITEAGDAHE